MPPIIPADAEIEAINLASRLLGQLHQNLNVTSDCTVACTDCGSVWLCDVYNGKLRLTEATEGNGSCEAEILRAISLKGLYAELGRRRVSNRRTVGRKGGRPRKDGTPARRRTAGGSGTGHQLPETTK